MFPWNIFGGKNQSPFDSIPNFNENEFQKMLDQWMKHTFPEYLNLNKANNQQQQQQQQQQQNNASPTQKTQASVYETHDDIYIRFPLSDEKLLDHLKIYYSINKCMISGLSEDQEPYTIILPAIVKKKGAKAVYRDQILEIRIPKSMEWQLSEIDVDKRN